MLYIPLTNLVICKKEEIRYKANSPRTKRPFFKMDLRMGGKSYYHIFAIGGLVVGSQRKNRFK